MNYKNFIQVKLVTKYGWNQVILLYEDNYALRSLQPLLDVTATSGGQFKVMLLLLRSILYFLL